MAGIAPGRGAPEMLHKDAVTCADREMARVFIVDRMFGKREDAACMNKRRVSIGEFAIGIGALGVDQHIRKLLPAARIAMSGRVAVFAERVPAVAGLVLGVPRDI